MPANLRRIISIMSKYRSETQEMSYNFNQETRNRGQVSPFFWFLGFQIPDPDLNRRAQHAELIHISEFLHKKPSASALRSYRQLRLTQPPLQLRRSDASQAAYDKNKSVRRGRRLRGAEMLFLLLARR